MIIAIDFDGTIVGHKYPTIGKEIPFALEILRKLQIKHHELILWGAREDKPLDEAVTFYRERGLKFYTVNRDYPEEKKNLNNYFSRKLRADIFIDGHNLGSLPDWGTIHEIMSERLPCEDLMRKYESGYEPERPKSLFSRLFR